MPVLHFGRRDTFLRVNRMLIEFHCTFFYLRYSNHILSFYSSISLPSGEWMDYRCRIGSLFSSSTTSGRIDPAGTVGPSYN